MTDDKDKLYKMERALLELGSEIFRLKSNMHELHNSHEKFVKIMDGLRLLLDEKGLILEDDFDSAIDLKNAVSGLQCTSPTPLLMTGGGKTRKDFH
jgi:hypothetical protein